MDIKHLPKFIVWSFKKSKNLNHISSDEIKIAKSLRKEKAYEFTASRAAIRLALSKIFVKSVINFLDIKICCILEQFINFLIVIRIFKFL